MNQENNRRQVIPEEALTALEERIRHPFANRKLLIRALTHSSWSNETGERNHHLLCNERLEFLGDSILSLVVSEHLFKIYPHLPEGDLTRMRRDVVCADALARYAKRIDLGSCLLLGIGEEKTGGREKINILADAFEALLAAIFVDAGRGGEAIRAVADLLIPLVSEDLRVLEAGGMDSDYKTPLQELVQRTEGDVLEYILLREEGPDHAKTFEVEVRLNSNVIGHGIGRSRKRAEQAAARDALALFGVK